MADTASYPIRIDSGNVASIVAVDKKTGDQYPIGTTKVFSRNGWLKNEYTYYSFRFSHFDITPHGGFRFEVARSSGVIGNQDTMYLEFKLKEGE